MRNEWVFRRCPRYLRRLVKRHWQNRQHRVERLLSHFQRNVCELRICLNQINRPGIYEGHMVLRLLTATIRVETRDSGALAAIDDLMDQLVRRINRHVERLKKDWPLRKCRPNRAAMSAAGRNWIEMDGSEMATA